MKKIKFMIRLFFNTSPAVFILSVVQLLWSIVSVFFDIKIAVFGFLLIALQGLSILQKSEYEKLYKKYIDILSERK